MGGRLPRGPFRFPRSAGLVGHDRQQCERLGNRSSFGGHRNRLGGVDPGVAGPFLGPVQDPPQPLPGRTVVAVTDVEPAAQHVSLDLQEILVVGDEIVTSGLGGIYPKGLRLGRVAELRDAGGRLTRIAMIDPAVDLGQLEQVFVMLRRGPTMDLLYRANRAENDLEGPVSVSSPPPEEAEAAAALAAAEDES